MRILLVTAPPEAGAPLLRQLIEDRVVAGGNIIPGLRSLYRWKGEVCDEPEVLLVMETSAEDIQLKITAIEEAHPYEVPKIVAFEPKDALEAYVAWVRAHS
ncbi:MAG: divalent-cation tolerance protein CutA [Alphaproteobacteria bacterium]|nr:divalent-cation tolerance protein CutA [Alphaproteobacteria bacterium]MCB9794780.1 divalent-cation tolerance protein CutA [Alphaproteobacteria bacterium]